MVVPHCTVQNSLYGFYISALQLVRALHERELPVTLRITKPDAFRPHVIGTDVRVCVVGIELPEIRRGLRPHKKLYLIVETDQVVVSTDFGNSWFFQNPNERVT